MSGIQAPWVGCSREEYESRFENHNNIYDYENDEYYTDEEEFEDEPEEEYEEDECEDCKLHFDENGNLIPKENENGEN